MDWRGDRIVSAERAKGRVIAGAFGALALFAAIAGAIACLPSLREGPSQLHPPSSGPACGDGVIDYDGPDGGERCDPGDAAVTGCTRGCAIDCVGGYVDPADDHCYFIGEPSSALTYEVALAACKTANAHVVTFESDDTRDRVLGALETQFAPSWYWVGLSTEPMQNNAYVSAREGEPGYAKTCSGCYFFGLGAQGNVKRLDYPDGGAATGGPWVIDAPRSRFWYQFGGATLDAVGRSIAPKVLCEREPPGSSSEPCSGAFCVSIRATLGQKRYVVVPSAASGDDAQRACATPLVDGGAGGRLVVFPAREEREAVLQEVRAVLEPYGFDNGFDKVWIGLARASDTDSWRWDDGSPVTAAALPWAGNQPADAGGALRAYAEIDPDLHYDVQLARVDDASAKHPYICEYRP